MKKVIILGASGSLAHYVIKELEKNSDIQLTLFLRDKNRLKTKVTKDCKVIEGDVLNENRLNEAISDQDIVYVNLSGDLWTMAENIEKAMVETGVQRVIAISSIGIYDEPIKPVLIPYRKLADVFEGSSLDYTIIRPAWFTSVDEVDYEITRKGKPERGTVISMKSIADLVYKIVESSSLYSRESVSINKPNS